MVRYSETTRKPADGNLVALAAEKRGVSKESEFNPRLFGYNVAVGIAPSSRR
jgi:hypothetical protein